MTADGAHPNDALVGTWRVLSTQTLVTNEDGSTYTTNRDMVGYVILTKEQRILAFVADRDRPVPQDEAGLIANARSAVAYTGKYDLHADHYVAHLEFTSTQLALDVPQVRYFAIDGDNLSISTEDAPSVTLPGKRMQTMLKAVRERD